MNSLTRIQANFLALLQFRHEAEDLSVQQDFHTIPGCGSHSTTYRSPQVQNELVECCGEVILESVLEEVRAAPFYSVLADELNIDHRSCLYHQ